METVPIIRKLFIWALLGLAVFILALPFIAVVVFAASRLMTDFDETIRLISCLIVMLLLVAAWTVLPAWLTTIAIKLGERQDNEVE